jgi:hypothetical protein
MPVVETSFVRINGLLKSGNAEIGAVIKASFGRSNAC